MNSKVWADHTANIASGALIVITYTDRMILLAIYLSGFVENMFGAKLNTVATLLTPLRNYNNLSMPLLKTSFHLFHSILTFSYPPSIRNEAY